MIALKMRARKTRDIILTVLKVTIYNNQSIYLSIHPSEEIENNIEKEGKKIESKSTGIKVGNVMPKIKAPRKKTVINQYGSDTDTEYIKQIQEEYLRVLENCCID